MVVDVHAHLYPRAFMEAVGAHGPTQGVSLSDDRPPFLCFGGIRYWRYAAAFHDVDARLRQMDEAGVDRQVLSLGPPMTHWPTRTSPCVCAASSTTRSPRSCAGIRTASSVSPLPGRPVIGSDAPFAVGDLARSVREVRTFPFLPERDRARILGDNALRFLGLEK